jgi:hypothetical protein
MRASILVVIIAVLCVGKVMADDSSVSAAPPVYGVLSSSAAAGLDCIPDEDGPNNDIIVYVGSSTGLWECVGYNTGNCASDVENGGSVAITTKPLCSQKYQASSYYYGGSTWSGLNMTQLIIVCVLVGVAGLAAVVAVSRAVYRHRKAVAVVADEKSVPVIEVSASKV